MTEVKTMSALRHLNIVNMLEYHQDGFVCSTGVMGLCVSERTAD